MVVGGPHASFTKLCPPLPLFHWCLTADEPNVFVPASGKKINSSQTVKTFAKLYYAHMCVCVRVKENVGLLCALTWKWSVHFFFLLFFFCHVLLLSNGRCALEFPSADGNVSVQPTHTHARTHLQYTSPFFFFLPLFWFILNHIVKSQHFLLLIVLQDKNQRQATVFLLFFLLSFEKIMINLIF